MKTKMRYIACILLTIAIGCSKSTTQTGKDSIVGKWLEIQYLADPGDGSGTWQTYSGNKSYLIFNADSSGESSGTPSLKYYHLLSDSTLTLEFDNGNSFLNSYKIENNTLTLTGGCIEACGSKYTKVLN